MSSIAEKLRAARRFEHKIGEITFRGHRATPDQYSRYKSATSPVTDGDIARLHIDGVDGAKESDLFDGGAKTPWKYDPEDFAEAIVEKPEWYKPLAEAVLRKAKEKYNEKVDNEKN